MDEAAVRIHLEHLEKPLRYATRHNFAHLAKLRGLEPYVQHHVRALQALDLTAPLAAVLEQFLQTAQGVDVLALSAKRQRLQEAERLLQQLYAALPTETPAVPAAPLPEVAVPQESRPAETTPASDSEALLQPV